MDTANISIELHNSVKQNPIFKPLSKLPVTKNIIFKYGILNEDVPKKIKENDFDYLEGKIPHLAGLYTDFIELDSDKIISLADDETSKRLSEVMGVGVGLYYSTKLLKINPTAIKRIPRPNTKKGKYLDFRITKGRRLYEVETKGTVYHNKINAIIKDVQGKKRDSNTVGCKFGVITLANKEDNKQPSKIVVCDDFNDNKSNDSYSINDYFEYYKIFLSFILDSTYYNRLVSQIERDKIRKNIIKINRIKGEYGYGQKTYKGRYFDRRLVLDVIADYYSRNMRLFTLFKLLTSKMGRQKYFLGIDPQVLELLNSKNVLGLTNYLHKQVLIEESNKSCFIDIDGIIFVSSRDGGDKQFEHNFPEKDVKERLGYMIGFIENDPHQCGAPCRSREKEGKPCEKLTFRDHCHFHRD